MLYPFLKRALDILGGFVGLVIFSPVMLLAALHIKRASPDGPVFADMKDRAGKDGKEFKMFKFRTMIPNAQEFLQGNPELYRQYQENGYKLDPDPRFIRGATFLRKYSIDEMPQFLNILLGNMSLVGPRAYFTFELNEQQERYPETKEDVKKALCVKPGLTGPWQVGGRSKLSFVERIGLDAEYAENKSILYDLFIIIKTPFAVVTGRGAL